MDAHGNVAHDAVARWQVQPVTVEDAEMEMLLELGGGTDATPSLWARVRSALKCTLCRGPNDDEVFFDIDEDP